jgi:hypothetical protein
MKKPK